MNQTLALSGTILGQSLRLNNKILLHTHQLWITESIANSHPLEVDFHLGSRVVFMNVIRNGRNILPCI